MSRHEQKPHEEVNIISGEMKSLGIKLLPPDLGLSKVDFTIEGSSIRYGLSSIKGISTKSLEGLEKFRESEKPNKFQIFRSAKAAGINIGVLSSLIQAGTLTEYKTHRPRLVLEAQAWNTLTEREKSNMEIIGKNHNYDLIDCIKECVEKNLLAEDGRPIFNKSRYETFKTKMEKYKQIYKQNSQYESFANWYFETQLLGYSANLRLKEIIGEGDYLDSSDLPYIEGFSKNKFIGTVVVSKKAKSRSSGNDYILLELCDESGRLKAMLCDNKKFKKCTEFLESGKPIPEKGDIVVVTGSKSKEDNTIFVDSIQTVSECIYIKLKDLPDEAES